VIRVIALALAAGLGAYDLALGLWAFLSPESFYASIASFPPYNRHLLHDVGAFLSGLGAGLLFGLRRRRLLGAAAAGNAAAALFHLYAHIEDTGLGGHPYDVPALGVIAALSLVLMVAALWPAGSEVKG
jgi:hypothetical protein